MTEPILTPADLADRSKLGTVLDAVVQRDDNYRRLTQRVLATQERLQQRCDEDAWVEYLDIESIVNARIDSMLAVVAKFAFEQGRRHERQGR